MATSLLVREDGPLTVRVEQGGDSLAVRAIGEVDMATAPTLEESLRFAFGHDSSSTIQLDLARVSFMDSTGLQVLLWAAERQDGTRLRIRCGSGAVRTLLGLTGVEDKLPLT